MHVIFEMSSTVVLKLFQEEAPLRRVNYFVAPPKENSWRNILKLTILLTILDCTKNKLIYKLTMLEQQFCL